MSSNIAKEKYIICLISWYVPVLAQINNAFQELTNCFGKNKISPAHSHLLVGLVHELHSCQKTKLLRLTQKKHSISISNNCKVGQEGCKEWKIKLRKLKISITFFLKQNIRCMLFHNVSRKLGRGRKQVQEDSRYPPTILWAGWGREADEEKTWRGQPGACACRSGQSCLLLLTASRCRWQTLYSASCYRLDMADTNSVLFFSFFTSTSFPLHLYANL